MTLIHTLKREGYEDLKIRYHFDRYEWLFLGNWKSINMTKDVIEKQLYDNALERTWELMQIDPEAGSPEFDELDKLADWIVAYDEIHYPIGGESK